MKIFLRALLPLVIAACGIGAHMPAEYQGDIQVQIANGLDAKICTFSMTPIGAAKPSPNWLGSYGVHSASYQPFNVKKGEYMVHVAGCGDEFHSDLRVRISGPTTLAIGSPIVARGAGAYVTMRPIGHVGWLQQSGGGGGEAPAEESPTAACWPNGHPCSHGNDPCCGRCGSVPGHEGMNNAGVCTD